MQESRLYPGSGRSPGEGNGNPHQYSYMENPMDRGAWWVSVHGVTRDSDMIKLLNHQLPSYTRVYTHMLFLALKEILYE